MPRGTGHTNDSQALWARSLKQRFWLENCRICLQLTYCGNVFFFFHFMVYFCLFTRVFNILCKRLSSLLEAWRTFFASLIFFLARGHVCGNESHIKSRLIALLNITLALLALVLCFISCWKNILFSLLSRLFVAKNSFYNHINFYVEVTNALKVVYREVLRHRPYNRKTAQKWNWKHSPTNEPSLPQVIFNCFILCTFAVVSHLNNTHPTHFTVPFTTYSSFKNVSDIERLILDSVRAHNYIYQ